MPRDSSMDVTRIREQIQNPVCMRKHIHKTPVVGNTSTLNISDLQHFPVAIFLCAYTFYISIIFQERYIIFHSSFTYSKHCM